MDAFIANLIYSIHIILIASIAIVPFIGSPYFLLLHSIFVPFLIFHWLLNNNTCILTTIEKKLRGVKDDDTEKCISCKLIDPMFMFVANRKSTSAMIYYIVISLWLISFIKLSHVFYSRKVKNLQDLFKMK